MRLLQTPVSEMILESVSTEALRQVTHGATMDAVRCPHCGDACLKLQGVASQNFTTVSVINARGAASKVMDVDPEPWTIVLVFLCGYGHRSSLAFRQDGEVLTQTVLKIDA